MVVPVTCPFRLWGGRNPDLMMMMMPLRDPSMTGTSSLPQAFAYPSRTLRVSTFLAQ